MDGTGAGAVSPLSHTVAALCAFALASLAGATASAGTLSGPILDDGVTAELIEVAQLPATSTFTFARINFLREAPDSSGRLFVNDLRGPMRIIDGATLHTYFDMAVLRPAFKDSPGLGAGFVSFDFHPEFATNGLFYTVHTETVGATPPTHGPAIGAAIVQHAVLTEWTAAAPSSNSFTGTSRELMRIEAIHHIHNAGEVAFNPNAVPGDADYDLLYMAGGEYGSIQQGNPAQLQRLDTLYGTIIRIDPLGGTGAPYSYGIPASNPFASDGDPNTFDEIYAYGFRNAHRLHWDTVGAKAAFVSDIGEHSLEEINRLSPGANYGWAEREGTFEYDVPSGSVGALPANDASFGFTYPVAQYDHEEGQAIAGGAIDRSFPSSALYGKFIFGDIASGRLFYTDVLEMLAADDGDPATVAQVYELNLLDGGVGTTLLDIVRTKKGQPGLGRVDLRFGSDLSGNIYLLTKQDGVVRRLVVEASVPTLPVFAAGLLAVSMAGVAARRLRSRALSRLDLPPAVPVVRD